jgi:DNA-binding PadR family transcriptional regulator
MPTASGTKGSVETKLGPPAYVVLGMVSLGACSGYEIKQMVELSIRFFWTISQAQIYPSLELLERAGLVSGRELPRGRRARRVYEITAAGEAALAAWLRADEPMPFELRDIGMVKLFFAGALECDDALSLLEAVRRRSEERVTTLQRIESTARLAEQQGNAYPLVTLRMGVEFHKAMIEVCREFEPQLAALRPGPSAASAR